MSVSLEDADDTAYAFINPGETVTVNHEGQFPEVYIEVILV
jgi:hypothetical protein